MRTNFGRSISTLATIATAATAVLAFASSGRASEVGFTFTGGTPAFGQAGTVGLYFTPSQDIVIDALGFFDFGQDGIQDHQVGIWASNGAFQRSVTVTTANSTLSGPVFNGGQYRFTPITPLAITFGGGNILGAEIGANNTDQWYTGVTTVDNSNLVALAQTLGRFTANGFSYPDMNGGPFGAGAFLVSVPEPNCVALFSVLGAIFGIRRRVRN